MKDRSVASDDPVALVHVAGEALLAAVLVLRSDESSPVDAQSPPSRPMIDELARLPSLIALLAHVHIEPPTGDTAREVAGHAARLTSALVACRPSPHPRTS